MYLDKYRFSKALRPFSLSVGFFACLTGILIANLDGYADPLTAFLIIVAGLVLQVGVNLINDLSDLAHLNDEHYAQSRLKIIRNAYIGCTCFCLAACIGLYLVFQVGPLLLLLFLIGLIGAVGYTVEPLNYKRRGLAVVLVFWLMGVMMIVGTYYILSSTVSLHAFLLSIPISLFTSLLLLSNELRDYEDDLSIGMGTLSVRLGYGNAVLLYKIIILLIYLSVLLLGIVGNLVSVLLLIVSLFISLYPCRLLSKVKDDRYVLTKETGRSFLVFGTVYCLFLAL